MTTNKIEHRYSEDAGLYTLRTWEISAGIAPDVSVSGGCDQRPPWLEVIVTAAKLGGHPFIPAVPPPDLVLWFETTEDRELIQFKGIGQQLTLF